MPMRILLVEKVLAGAQVGTPWPMGVDSWASDPVQRLFRALVSALVLGLGGSVPKAHSEHVEHITNVREQAKSGSRTRDVHADHKVRPGGIQNSRSGVAFRPNGVVLDQVNEVAAGIICQLLLTNGRCNVDVSDGARKASGDSA